MSASFSSFSTTLSVKHGPPPQEEQTRLRFHKVSLVGDGQEGAGAGLGEEPEYRWRNRFEGVSQYRAEEESHAAPSYLSHQEPDAGQGWSLGEEAEPGRGESRGGREPRPERSAALRLSDGGRFQDDEESPFTGVFQATLVELEEPAAPPCSPPASPDFDSPITQDMESLVDTLRSMGPSLRPRAAPPPRAPAPAPLSSLPPIVEDAASGPLASDLLTAVTSPTRKQGAETLNGLYALPADLGLKRNSSRDTRSPLELMKLGQQGDVGSRAANLPVRASASGSVLMRQLSESSVEDLKSPLPNGSGSGSGSRLDNSVIFGSYRSSSLEQPPESGMQRSLYRSGSLPDSEVDGAPGSRLERLSFLLNSSTSSLSSLTGSEELNVRMSRPPSLGLGLGLGMGMGLGPGPGHGHSPPSGGSPAPLLSPGRLLSPTSPMDLPPPLPVFGPMSTPLLQRSFGGEGGLQHPSSLAAAPAAPPPRNEPDRNLMAKYRAFPDAYLTKEKEHGKLNPRPGKLYVFDRPGMCGQRIEVRGDVTDATSWELQETISIRVVRGGWVLYEKPNFKGEKVALDEGDIELTCPFTPPEELQQEGQEEPTEEEQGQRPAPRFIIGSIRRAVRDYSVPEISLFPEENAEGKKVIFRDTSDDARIFGFPIKANSIIINAGLWLVYAQPFFQGVPRVLEVGGFPNAAAWGVEQPYVGSLHPLKVGEPRVEEQSEPSMVIYEKPYFSGKSRTISRSSRDFMTREDKQQMAFMYNVGSLKVQGGIWVGYEKEGFRGHQYLLEEGEYQDWRVWGGRDSELRSVRVIRADLSDPLMLMFEQPEEQDDGQQEENTFEVTEAIPDVELFGYKTSTRSIQVISGAWVAYSHVDFSGDQFILEKGFYNNCADWGSQDTRICSVQPILLAPADSSRRRKEIILYSEPNFGGERRVFHRNQEALTNKLQAQSCRVVGGSWVVYDEPQYSGNLYVVSEGEYPNLHSMGCPPDATLRSLKTVPTTFCVPSISLFGLECFEGREITTDTEISSMLEEGFNNHILSLRVNSGCWVICEHSHYRGRQFLLEPIEITNWPKFSSLQTVGSMYPVRQRRHFFRIKNKERGHFLSVQGGAEEMKSGRVVVTEEVEPLSDIWFYQDGLIKSKLSPTMSLQVMGNIEQAAKVVLWSETRQPVQTWAAQMSGLISSLTFTGMVLDVKGGKTYDKDHVVIMAESEERPCQQWEVELL